MKLINGISYSATSLNDVADYFDELARQLLSSSHPTKKAHREANIKAQTYRNAAAVLRSTTLAPVS